MAYLTKQQHTDLSITINSFGVQYKMMGVHQERYDTFNARAQTECCAHVAAYERYIYDIFADRWYQNTKKLEAMGF
jgi:hypothetical protein